MKLKPSLQIISTQKGKTQKTIDGTFNDNLDLERLPYDLRQVGRHNHEKKTEF